MRETLRDKVVVITGASSGIGYATAEACARRGAAVVLAARRAEALEQVASRCRELGGEALAVPTDVTDRHQVERLAQRAVGRFGRIDAWVNNAAVSLFGRFEEVPAEAFERVLETNVLGYVHGVRAVLGRFREQGRGTLVNVSSVVSTMSQPYTTAYVMSKAAIRAMSDCLRMELELDEAPGIRVCTVLPASIDTPLFQYAGNYAGRLTRPMKPVYPANQVARAIVRMIRRPRRECYVGTAGRLMALERKFAPGLWEKAGAHLVDRDHFQQRAAEPSRGNLYEALDEKARISGGWLPAAKQRPGSALESVLVTAAALVAPLALLLLGPGKASRDGAVRRAARTLAAATR